MALEQALEKRRKKLEATESQHTFEATGSSSSSSNTQADYSTADQGSEWVLYYSEEGYPYYYNQNTGESQWAYNQDDSAAMEHSTEYEATSGTMALKGDDRESSMKYSSSEEEDDDGDNDEDSDSGSESGSGSAADSSASGESDSDSEDETRRKGKGAAKKKGKSDFDDETEAKFAEYLQSAAGKAMLQREKDRLEKKLTKRQRRMEADKTYAAKKRAGGGGGSKGKSNSIAGLVPFGSLSSAGSRSGARSRDDEEEESDDDDDDAVNVRNRWMPPSPPSTSRLIQNAEERESMQRQQNRYGGSGSGSGSGNVVTSRRNQHSSSSSSDRGRPLGVAEVADQYKKHKIQSPYGDNSSSNSNRRGGYPASSSTSAVRKATDGISNSSTDTSSEEDDEDEFSDDSDIETIEAPTVPQWLQWGQLKEGANSLINKTIIMTSQLILKATGSTNAGFNNTGGTESGGSSSSSAAGGSAPAQYGGVNLSNAAQISVAVFMQMGRTVSSVIQETMTQTDAVMQRNNVYSWLDSSVEIPLPTSWSSLLLSAGSSSSQQQPSSAADAIDPEVVNIADDSDMPQNPQQPRPPSDLNTAVWAALSNTWSNSTQAVWGVVNAGIESLIDEIDKDRLRQQQLAAGATGAGGNNTAYATQASLPPQPPNPISGPPHGNFYDNSAPNIGSSFAAQPTLPPPQPSGATVHASNMENTPLRRHLSYAEAAAAEDSAESEMGAVDTLVPILQDSSDAHNDTGPEAPDTAPIASIAADEPVAAPSLPLQEDPVLSLDGTSGAPEASSDTATAAEPLAEPSSSSEPLAEPSSSSAEVVEGEQALAVDPPPAGVVMQSSSSDVEA